MGGELVHKVSLLFSLVTGTSAAVLSILLLEILNKSRFGRIVVVLSLLMVIFVSYHAILVLWTGELVIAEGLKSAMFTVVAGFVWLVAWNQYRMQRRAPSEVNSR